MRSGQDFDPRGKKVRFRPQSDARSEQRSRTTPNIRSDAQYRKFTRVCPLCKAANRKDTEHFLSMCKFLPKSDKDFMSKARQVLIEDEFRDETEDFEDHPQGDYHETDGSSHAGNILPRVGRVNVRASPQFNTFFHHNPLSIIIDTGAETNLIRESTARTINCPIVPSSQVAFQADGKTSLNVVGETHITLTRDNLDFLFSGLVVNDLDVDILAGVPFMEENDISVRPKNKVITIGDKYNISYESSSPSYSASHKATILRASSKSTLWPGEYVEVAVEGSQDGFVAVEPHMSSPMESWPQVGLYKTVGNSVRFTNPTSGPVNLNKHSHIALVTSTFVPEPSGPLCPAVEAKPATANRVDSQTDKARPATIANNHSLSRRQPISVLPQVHGLFHSVGIEVNRGNVLPEEFTSKFKSLHRRFDSVFDPKFGIYNQSFGKFEAVVNMGAVKPPQRKGRVPQYSRDKLTELQCEIDRLESLGVLAKPEELDVTVEYLNPSFLVRYPKKPDKFRFVTAFNEVGRYCKPQPPLMPNVDSTLRSIARWKFLIKSVLEIPYQNCGSDRIIIQARVFL